MIEFDWFRLICSFLTGVMICQSGSLTQGVTQNPLASPSTLGFQAIIVLLILIVNSLGLAMGLEYSSIIIGVIGFIIISVLPSRKKVKIYSNRVEEKINQYLLIGLGVNLLIGAVFAIWHFFFMAINREFPSQIWFGHFRFVDSTTLMILGLSFVLISVFQFRYLKKLQLLSLGVPFFTALGEDLGKLQKRVIQIVYLQTLIIVSLFGVFSFAALIIPLVLKRIHFFATSLYREIFWGGLLGGVFFSLLDLFCYNITFYGAELPVGMLSSTIGAIIMVALLIRQNLKTS